MVIGLGNDRLEAALEAAIAHGARAATIFASCAVPGDEGRLRRSLSERARQAGFAVCGGNCMGFYNNTIGLRIAGYAALQPMPTGPVGLIAQSGSVFGAFAHNDPRLRFALAVSSGNEMVTTAADYLEWMVAQDEIRVVGLFLETVRDPQAFTRALEAAAERDVAVVALKVGRTARSAAMALTHTGAVAGSDVAYGAIFRRYGVVQVDDMDELAATLLLFQQGRRVGSGGLVAIHNSGGERELAVDLADRVGLTYPELHADTLERLSHIVDPELELTNPLDAWSSAQGFQSIFTESFKVLLADPNAALGVMFCDVRDNYYVSSGYAESALAAHAATDKPVAIAVNLSMLRHREIAKRLTDAGVPVLDGTSEALKAVKHVLDRRDFGGIKTQLRPAQLPLTAPIDAAGAPMLGESEVLDLLDRYGIATPRRCLVESVDQLRQAIEDFTFPVVLKTAKPEVLHKTEAKGVFLNLKSLAAVEAAYRDLTARLGPQAVLAEMVAGGVEVGIGAIHDPQFGPLIVVGGGGTLVELFPERAVALAPVSSEEAGRIVASLSLARLLAGYRGQPAADLDRVVSAIVNFSWLIADNAGLIKEADVNPLICSASSCIAVDGLIVMRGSA